MPLFYQPFINEGIHCLDPEESRHCIKVLRLTQGDSIKVIDGKGMQFNCQISDPNHRKCTFDIVNRIEPSNMLMLSFNIHIAISPTKNMDRIEWFIEKAVELGIQKISFFKSDNSERTVLKMDRIIRKAVSAMKQSGNILLPEIKELSSFKNLLTSIQADEKYICYVDSENNKLLYKEAKPSSRYCVLIGPEGDFSKKELGQAESHGFTKVSLGTSRLRTETAGISACHILNLINH